jgi:hypothetical protein
VRNILSFSFLSENLKTYRTIILSVLHGCETWSFTAREEHRLRVTENTMMRKIFGRKGDEVTVERRRLHNEELCDPYSSLNITQVIKSMRLVAYVARMGDMRSV